MSSSVLASIDVESAKPVVQNGGATVVVVNRRDKPEGMSRHYEVGGPPTFAVPQSDDGESPVIPMDGDLAKRRRLVEHPCSQMLVWQKVAHVFQVGDNGVDCG